MTTSNVEQLRSAEYPGVVARAEWLAARKALLAKEKELTRYRDAVNAERRRPGAPARSVFLRDGDRVFHTYSTYARGADLLAGTYNYLDLTPLGRQEAWEEPPGRSDSPFLAWVRHHDRYGDRAKAAASCGGSGKDRPEP